jgi:hypothetical protein
VARLKIVELYLPSPICLPGAVLNFRPRYNFNFIVYLLERNAYRILVGRPEETIRMTY